MSLSEAILELYLRTATDLPGDVEEKVVLARENEGNPTAKSILDVIIEDIRISRSDSKPICQDTGTPIFYVTRPKSVGEQEIRKKIVEATKVATKEIPLRPNSVNPLTGHNTGDNVGLGFPIIYFSEHDGDEIVVELLLKGGGSENVGGLYKLPDERLNASRDLDGVVKCVVDSVFCAQGRACPPYILGVALGGNKAEVLRNAEKQLFRKLDDRHPDKVMKDLESKIFSLVNKLGIGAAGLGGSTTALGVKAAYSFRHPASFFVGVSFGCWATRRRKLTYSGGEYEIE